MPIVFQHYLMVGGTAALPGYFHARTPYAGTKANTNWATRTQSSSALAGGRLDTDSTAQNNLYTQDDWFDTRTYKIALIHQKDADQGIYNITGINGTQTVDGYAAGASFNNYTEVTGISVTAGLKTVQVSMATKNASASAYGGELNTIAYVSTGA